MNRLVISLAHRCSRIQISSAQGLSCFSGAPQSSLIIPPPQPRISENLDIFPPTIGNPTPMSPVTLPAFENPQRVYTFPTLNRSPIVAPPPFLQQILEKMDPLPEKSPIQDPEMPGRTGMYLSPRLLTIRRRKMKKHKRRRRYDRDFFKYQKYHREKKLKAEREFIKRMKAHLAELEAFNPEAYVETIIADAKKEWSDNLAPTGKKLYPHWSRLMSLEELYGLPKSEYIDKKAGLPSEEDWERIQQLKKEYDIKYRGN